MSELTSKNQRRPLPHELTKLCLCCLEKDVTFVNLSTCKHFGILEKLCSISVPKMELGRLVCYRCHAKLKTIHDFKLQAEESFTLLRSRQYSAIKKDPKLNKAIMVSMGEGTEELHTNRTLIKPEQFPITSYPEVFSGCWLSDPHSSPIDEAYSDQEMCEGFLIKIKKEKSEEKDCPNSSSGPKVSKISTKASNYHIEVSGLHPDSPQDNEALSDLDTDDVPLAKVKREVEIEISIPKKDAEKVTAGSKQIIKTNLTKAAAITVRTCFPCTHCFEMFTSKETLKRHNFLMHNKPKKFLTPSKQQKLDVYAGIIKEITLTREELLLERETKLKSEAYLKRPHRCNTCIVSFDFEQKLKDHNVRKHQLGEKSSQCNICKSVFKNCTIMNEHNNKHYLRYDCTLCEKRFLTVNCVYDHCNRLHETKNKLYFSCTRCDFTTPTLGSYKYHQAKHKGRSRCLLCSKTFSSKANMKKHMFEAHGNKSEAEQTFQCEVCSKSYTTKYYLGVHIKTMHMPPSLSATEDSNFYCHMCNKIFKDEYRLKNHFKLHRNHRSEGAKRFICDICNESFLRKSYVRDHITWTHLKIIEFTCPHCNKSFPTQGRLRQHVKYVHEKFRQPRNKICDYCGEGFTTAMILRNHIRRHTGERPYQCAQCPSTFAQSGALHTHIKLVHTKKREQNY